jgi:hypothetical protein
MEIQVITVSMAPMFFLLFFTALGSDKSEIKDVYHKIGR